MALIKQAKTLSKRQVEQLLWYVGTTRNPLRNRLIVLLSVKAGLRAKEIAGITWAMVSNADKEIDEYICLTNIASKGKSGRKIPMHDEIQKTLIALRQTKEELNLSSRIIETERTERTTAQVIVNMFKVWYTKLDLNACSSHSGRRTFITTAARKIPLVGGSMRDVQILAGHSSLNTTQRYIEQCSEAQVKLLKIL